MNAKIGVPKVCASCRRLLRQSASYRAGRLQSYSTTATQNGRPFRMAVIGSGPAGFYTAYRVMSKINGAKVDMFEQLPVPFGLVRFGVAPDHPEVKNCQEKFEEVASSPDFRFIGNITVGHPSGHPDGASVELSSILRHYDAVLFAYGAAKDRLLGVPGETTLKGIYSAREFVGWYNGLPEHTNLDPDLTQGDEAVIIGQGNVALDVARMLLEDIDVLRKSDITEHALEILSKSRVKRVHIVGRRGPVQASFTIKEVRELIKLPGVAAHSVDSALIPPDLKKLPRAPRRLMELLLKGSPTPLEGSSKSWSLDFCLSPTEFVGIDDATSQVGTTKFEQTSLSDSFDPVSQVSGIGVTTSFPSSVVFRSIGYKSVALPEFTNLGIPFDSRRGVIQNDGLGRVVREVKTVDAAVEQAPYPGLYCAGWVKRGPTGVIASTMEDAFTTGDAIAHDWSAGAQFLGGKETPRGGWEAVVSDNGRPAAKLVDWNDWQKIDQVEKSRGETKGKEREKLVHTRDMLAVI